MNGWVTVTNNAGTTFKNTSLNWLVAGDVHRAREEILYKTPYYMATPTPRAGQFEEEALFEYHLYDLQRRTTLKNNEQKQISLLEATDIDVEKEYVYDDIRNWWWYGDDWSDTGEKKVDVMRNFNNNFNELADGYEYVWAVTLRNHKDEDIVVTILERTSGDWEITDENYNYTKVSNNEIEWQVPVKANGESTLTYP
ncbi:MAG: hypothetical protein U9N61_05630 [Euryarchaeota archaeon]|nr:hypothetical protein [Euryarchaeota archaeon]